MRAIFLRRPGWAATLFGVCTSSMFSLHAPLADRGFGLSLYPGRIETRALSLYGTRPGFIPAGRAIYSDRSAARSGADLFPEYYSILSPAVQLQNSYKSPENSTRAVYFFPDPQYNQRASPLPQGLCALLSNFKGSSIPFFLASDMLIPWKSHAAGGHILWQINPTITATTPGRLPPGRKSEQLGLLDLALFFLFVLPPVGILMIVIKLAGGGKKKGRHPYYMQQEQGRMGARTAQMGGQPGPVSHSGTVPAPNSLLSKMSAKAKKLTIVGAVLSACLWLRLHQLRVWKSVDASRHRLVSGRVGPHLLFLRSRAGLPVGRPAPAEAGCAPSAAIWP